MAAHSNAATNYTHTRAVSPVWRTAEHPILQCAAKVSTQIHAYSPGDARMGLDRQSGGSYDGLLLTTHTAMQSIESHFGVPRFSFGLAADHQYGYSALDGECEKR